MGVIGNSISLDLVYSRLMLLGMQHSGLGGGGFMLVRDSKGNHEAIGWFPDFTVRSTANTY